MWVHPMVGDEITKRALTRHPKRVLGGEGTAYGLFQIHPRPTTTNAHSTTLAELAKLLKPLVNGQAASCFWFSSRRAHYQEVASSNLVAATPRKGPVFRPFRSQELRGTGPRQSPLFLLFQFVAGPGSR